MKLHENKENIELLISNISERTGVREDVLEKDYYVTLLLEELSKKNNQNYAYFKGGTALYKALKSIRRFSEDIDLTVSVEGLPNASQEQKRLKAAVNDFKTLEFNEKILDKRGTISLERIFIDKIFVSEFYFIREMFIDFSKHIYDIAIMCSLDKICDLLNNDKKLVELILYKREEENNRFGGVSSTLEIKDFNYLKNSDFYLSSKFKNSLNTIHNVYVFDEKDKIDIKQIQSVLKMLYITFSKLDTVKNEVLY